MNGLPAEAAVWRVGSQQWTLRDELSALALERIDHWGLAQAYIHSDGKGLPKKSLHIARPWEADESEGSSEPKTENETKRDRYQKSRERAAFFG